MKPTFHDHGKKLEWMNAYGQWVISPVVSLFTYAGEEFAVVRYENGLANFRVISIASEETKS